MGCYVWKIASAQKQKYDSKGNCAISTDLKGRYRYPQHVKVDTEIEQSVHPPFFWTIYRREVNLCAFTERFGCEIRIIEIVKKYMDIGNTIEISDQNFYLGIVFFRSGDGLLDPKFRLMTHIRRYGGLEINFKKNIIFEKIDIFIEK